MNPHNEHDFSTDSWSHALLGVAKLAVIVFIGLSAMFTMVIALSGMFSADGDELYQQELRGWCNGRYPRLTFDQCVEEEGL